MVARFLCSADWLAAGLRSGNSPAGRYPGRHCDYRLAKPLAAALRYATGPKIFFVFIALAHG